MGMPSDDDVVQIQTGNQSGEPCIVTVNCPDKTGLGCNICRIILDFGLYITKGDVTEVHCELELSIEKVKVTTTPDGRVLDLFFVKDNKELLHTRRRQDETCERLDAALQESCISCELQLVDPEYEYNQGISSLSPMLAEELFRCELSDNEVRSQALSSDMKKLKKTNVTLEYLLSPAHTLIQMYCVDHKGLLYDIMRTLKDMNMKISYGRISPNTMGYRDLELFIQQKDGKKITDPRSRMQSVHV